MWTGICGFWPFDLRNVYIFGLLKEGGSNTIFDSDPLTLLRTFFSPRTSALLMFAIYEFSVLKLFEVYW